MTSPSGPTRSKETRVQPIFGWLNQHGENGWPAHLLAIVHGLGKHTDCGNFARMDLEIERQVPATPARLAWMLRNVASLAPQDGRRWQEPARRTAVSDDINAMLTKLDAGSNVGIGDLCLEGSTSADCLIECEHAFIWIEGKRFDWLSPSTTWDVSRDQLARNLEAVWSVASAVGKDYCVVICHENPLKHHEQCLVHGYRAETWSAGWPHISAEIRHDFAQRIGTVRWQDIAVQWPEVTGLPQLHDLRI